MPESIGVNLDNKMKLMLEARQAFFLDFYGKRWDELSKERIQGGLTIFFIKDVKDTISKLLPGVTGIYLGVDKAMDTLTKIDGGNVKNNFINKATDITLRILSTNISPEELEHRLEQKL
ncbi:MAG: hypothetical protein M3M85_01925 [bacterium]|nr:hypothetical protein [bacterium]